MSQLIRSTPLRFPDDFLNPAPESPGDIFSIWMQLSTNTVSVFRMAGLQCGPSLWNRDSLVFTCAMENRGKNISSMASPGVAPLEVFQAMLLHRPLPDSGTTRNLSGRLTYFLSKRGRNIGRIDRSIDSQGRCKGDYDFIWHEVAKVNNPIFTSRVMIVDQQHQIHITALPYVDDWVPDDVMSVKDGQSGSIWITKIQGGPYLP
ncbi:hypothetical protein C8Q76DRAFT_692271 [Earliella scabrosa]|nr:hypothetical protein C8Q76DRAFT_692271 [Earliella scabrosa]